MTRHILAVALWITLALTAPLFAQEPTAPDYEAWSELSAEVETAFETDVQIPELEDLRSRVAEYRTAFLEAQDANAAQIEAVQDQLDSLGDPPAEGESPESEQTAERREILQGKLDDLRAPVRAAEEAYTDADGLVAAIDSRVRATYAERTIARGPSPLNPANWTPALALPMETARAVMSEIRENWSARQDDTDGPSLLIPAVMALLGLLLVVRSSLWMWLVQRWAAAKTQRGRGVLDFVLSMGRVLLPVAGMALIAWAVNITGLAGPVGERLANGLVIVAVPLVTGFWLASAMFPADRTPPMAIPEDLLGPLRLAARGLAVSTTLIVAVYVCTGPPSPDDVAGPILLYVPRVILAVFLFRFGRLLMQVRRSAAEREEEGRTVTGTVTRMLGRLSVLMAVAGTVLASAGFGNATQIVLFPAVMTLALTGFLLILQRLVYDVYALVTGTAEGETDALAPVLIGFAITLTALPVYALIWGARIADLTEIWSRFRAGFTIGATRLSPADFLTFLLVFIIGYAATRFIQATLRNQVLPKTRMDVGGRNAITAGIGYVGILVALIAAVTSAGIDLSSLAIVAGALSVGIGFGLQNVVSNFVSGIILLIERPISQGDWISVNDQTGYVRDISVRSTRIETFDRTDVIVPNADLISGTVTNWTHGNNVGRVIVPIGVAHGTDTRRVEAILLEVAQAHPMVSLNPAPFIYFKGFGDSSLDFEIRAILRDVNFVLNVQSDMNHDIARRFAEEGIKIPFSQQDIWVRNPEALLPGEAGTTPTAPLSPTPQGPPGGPRPPETDTGDGGDGDGR